jgi:uncharacterized membrane protein
MENELKAAILLILISFAIGAYSYGMLPERVASHWGLSGQPNGYMPTALGAFLLPVIMLVLLAVFIIIPVIDPLRANIGQFKGYFYGFVLVITAVLFVIYVQTILWNLGTMISFNLTLPILLGCTFFYVGIALENTKRNWFVGIRTPWTISSDEVWDKTNRLGGTVFKFLGILMLVTIALPPFALIVVIGLLVAACVGLVLYSYVVYTKVMKSVKTPEKNEKRSKK